MPFPMKSDPDLRLSNEPEKPLRVERAFLPPLRRPREVPVCSRAYRSFSSRRPFQLGSARFGARLDSPARDGVFGRVRARRRSSRGVRDGARGARRRRRGRGGRVARVARLGGGALVFLSDRAGVGRRELRRARRPRPRLHRVRVHAGVHRAPRRDAARRDRGRARLVPAPAPALQRRVRPRHLRGLDPGRVPVRALSRARLRDGRHRVHLRPRVRLQRFSWHVRRLPRRRARPQALRRGVRRHLRRRVLRVAIEPPLDPPGGARASGVAYSLLFSSFESWAICEIDRLALDRRYLVPLFSTATFFNAVSAVAAGVAGNLAVDVEWGARMRDPPGKTRAAFVLPRGRLGDDEPSVASSGVFARDAVRTMKLKLERGASLGNKYSPAFDVGAVALLACARARGRGGRTRARAAPGPRAPRETTTRARRRRRRRRRGGRSGARARRDGWE